MPVGPGITTLLPRLPGLGTDPTFVTDSVESEHPLPICEDHGEFVNADIESERDKFQTPWPHSIRLLFRHGFIHVQEQAGQRGVSGKFGSVEQRIGF